MGGVGIFIKNNIRYSNAWINGGYRNNINEKKQEKNTKITSTFTYDGMVEKNYEDGKMSSMLECEGKIKKTDASTVMAIGTNPNGYNSKIPNGAYSDMDVYSVRIYNRGITEEEVQINSNADKRRYKNQESIPIYTEEQLLKMGTDEKVKVTQENKEYIYSAGKTYELKNNIETTNNNVLNKIKNGEVILKPNDYQIKIGTDYYTSKSKYTIAVNEYGYVTNGLELYLDGIDNTGNGHSSTTATWKDLSGKNRNGTLMNFGTIDAEDWTSDGLKFDGVDDYVPIAEMNYENVTMETVVMCGRETRYNQIIINNIEQGGYRIQIGGTNFDYKNKGFFNVYIENEYKNAEQLEVCYENVSENEKVSISGSYDGNKITNRSKNYYNLKEEKGTIKKTAGNTYIGLGGNMEGNKANQEFFNGTIHCARLYSRALTDEEQAVNFLNDRERFGL